ALILLISDDKSAVSSSCGNVSNKSIPALSAFSSKTLDIPVPKSESSCALITVVKSSSNFSFNCWTYSKNPSGNILAGGCILNVKSKPLSVISSAEPTSTINGNPAFSSSCVADNATAVVYGPTIPTTPSLSIF